jgi:hypothetical protein
MNPLLWVFRFTFGCRHRHLSRVFTIKRRTYRVCFDCGEEFDLPGIHAPLRFSVADSARLATKPAILSEPSAIRADSQAPQL